MTANVPFYLEDVNERMAAGWTHLRLYRYTAPAPADAFTNMVQALPLVVDEKLYEFVDAGGSPAYWYRVALHNATLDELSTLGDPFRADVTTLLDVMGEAASMAGAGFKSVCTSVGTVSSLVDVGLIDSGVANDFLEAGYIYRPNGSPADQQRRVAKGGFDFTAGALRPTRSWANQPAEGELYYVFLLLPPFDMPGAGRSWADAARAGLSACEYEDAVDVGTGTVPVSDEFDLAPHLGWLRDGDVRGVRIETYDLETGATLTRQNAGKNGRYWSTQPNGRGSLKLIIRPYPVTTLQHVIVEANRRDAEIYAADDITGCPLNLAAAATLWKAYDYLDTTRPGKFTGEKASAYSAFLEEMSGERPGGERALVSLADPGKREHEQKLRLDGVGYLVATPQQQSAIGGGGGRQWQVVSMPDQKVEEVEDALPILDSHFSEGAGFTFEGIDGVYEIARGWDPSAPGKLGTWPMFAPAEEKVTSDYKGWLVNHGGYLYMLRGRYAMKYALDALQFGVELEKFETAHDFGSGMVVGGEPLSVNGELFVPILRVADHVWQPFARLPAVSSPDVWDASVDVTLTAQCFTAWKAFVVMAMDGNQVRTGDPLADLSDDANWAPSISGDGYRIGPEGSTINELYVHGAYLIAVTDRGVFYMDESYEIREGIPDIRGWADDRMGVGGGYANGQLLIPTRGGPVRWAPDGDWAVVGPQMEGALEGDLTPGWGRVSGVASYGQWTWVTANGVDGVASLWSFLPPRSSRVPYAPHSHQQEEESLYEDCTVLLAGAQPLQRYSFELFSDDAAIGSIPWVEPELAGANDGTAATAAAGTTHYLKALNPDPGLPLDADLRGVELVVKRYTVPA